jgi:hypothetical protein
VPVFIGKNEFSCFFDAITDAFPRCILNSTQNDHLHIGTGVFHVSPLKWVKSTLNECFTTSVKESQLPIPICCCSYLLRENTAQKALSKTEKQAKNREKMLQKEGGKRLNLMFTT